MQIRYATYETPAAAANRNSPQKNDRKNRFLPPKSSSVQVCCAVVSIKTHSYNSLKLPVVVIIPTKSQKEIIRATVAMIAVQTY